MTLKHSFYKDFKFDYLLSGNRMICSKFYKSQSVKMLENRGSLIFVENKIKPKTCKLLVNSILALANPHSIRV